MKIPREWSAAFRARFEKQARAKYRAKRRKLFGG